ncbi:MAG: histidine--tRNA ligase [Gemmatimonadota bacterium]
MEISGLPGFRDFYPEELALRNHILGAWREVAERYGFQEYDGPPLEPLELYTRKSGPEIVEQLYRFTDRGGREVALRPEMTPTFARMIAARAAGLPKPVRWYSMPQLFRYERPQRGRLREHFQLNLDIVGEENPLADAEVVAAALDVTFALGLGAGDVVARVSDRRLAGAVLTGLGVPEAKLPEAFAALDRAEREGERKARARLEAAGLPGSAAGEVLALAGLGLEEVLKRHGASAQAAEAGERLTRFFGHMGDLGLSDAVRFDAGLVRGLAYYTGLVFEVWERRGELRAICGGGRYDDLLGVLGGVDLPAVGFGMGDVVLGELLKERGLGPEPAAAVEDFVVCVSEAERPLALRVVRELRARGRRVTFDYRGRSVGRQFRAADRAGASRVVVVGPDEAAREAVRLRWLETGEEEEVSIGELLSAPRGGSTPASGPDTDRTRVSGKEGGREEKRRGEG